jgi:hypothetical protein
VTDARYPERWLNDRRILRLSDPAFRLFVTALVWSVANRTEGVIDEADLSLIPQVDGDRSAELAKAGLWHREHDTWVIDCFADSQTSKSQLDGLDLKRRQDALRAATYRARKSRDSSRDDKGQARPGQARTGSEEKELEEQAEQEAWPTVAGAADTSWADGLYERD